MILKIDDKQYYNTMDILPAFFSEKIDDSQIVKKYKILRYRGNGLVIRTIESIPRSEFMIFPITKYSNQICYIHRHSGQELFLDLEYNESDVEYAIAYKEITYKEYYGEYETLWDRIKALFKGE